MRMSCCIGIIWRLAKLFLNSAHKKTGDAGFFMNAVNASLKLSDCFDFSVHSALHAGDLVFSEDAFANRCV